MPGNVKNRVGFFRDEVPMTAFRGPGCRLVNGARRIAGARRFAMVDLGGHGF